MSQIEKSIEIQLKDKKIGIFGLGRSGLAAYELVKHFTNDLVVVNSGDPQNFKLAGAGVFLSDSDPNAQIKFSDCEIILLSPGIAREHFALELAQKNNVKIINEIELGYKILKNENIRWLGITGTNGKTTTTTMLGEILNDQGKKTFVGGNIGIPLLEMVQEIWKNKKNDYQNILLELSSFQLESLFETRFHAGVILNIFPNHGERYKDTKEYAMAKWRLQDLILSKGFFCSGKNHHFYDLEKKRTDILSLNLEWDKDDWLTELGIEVDLNHFHLVGNHNLQNLFMAYQLLRVVGHFDKKKLENTLEHFHGVHHRVERVGTFLGVEFFNDAKSTNFEATLTAIKAMPKKIPLILILGGQKRGRGDSALEVLENLKKTVQEIYLIGETSDLLYSELKDHLPTFKTQDLAQTLNVIKNKNFEGTVLFSPAYPSFDQFKNYAHRGDVFKKLIFKIFI
jgi:UDP-N-acetylmuramoylalanine--D-glutamate ligase